MSNSSYPDLLLEQLQAELGQLEPALRQATLQVLAVYGVIVPLEQMLDRMPVITGVDRHFVVPDWLRRIEIDLSGPMTVYDCVPEATRRNLAEPWETLLDCFHLHNTAVMAMDSCVHVMEQLAARELNTPAHKWAMGHVRHLLDFAIDGTPFPTGRHSSSESDDSPPAFAVVPGRGEPPSVPPFDRRDPRSAAELYAVWRYTRGSRDAEIELGRIRAERDYEPDERRSLALVPDEHPDDRAIDLAELLAPALEQRVLDDGGPAEPVFDLSRLAPEHQDALRHAAAIESIVQIVGAIENALPVFDIDERITGGWPRSVLDLRAPMNASARLPAEWQADIEVAWKNLRHWIRTYQAVSEHLIENANRVVSRVQLRCIPQWARTLVGRFVDEHERPGDIAGLLAVAEPLPTEPLSSFRLESLDDLRAPGDVPDADHAVADRGRESNPVTPSPAGTGDGIDRGRRYRWSLAALCAAVMLILIACGVVTHRAQARADSADARAATAIEEVRQLREAPLMVRVRRWPGGESEILRLVRLDHEIQVGEYNITVSRTK